MWTRRLFDVLATVGALTAAVSAETIIERSRLTYTTFSGPVALPGVTLPAGTYRFELADPNVTNIVRVRSKAGSTIYFMGFTDRVKRPDRLPAGPHVSLGEAPRGAAAPLSAWYPEGETFGHRFRYPGESLATSLPASEGNGSTATHFPISVRAVLPEARFG